MIIGGGPPTGGTRIFLEGGNEGVEADIIGKIENAASTSVHRENYGSHLNQGPLTASAIPFALYLYALKTRTK